MRTTSQNAYGALLSVREEYLFSTPDITCSSALLVVVVGGQLQGKMLFPL
jgi:hypothetical protein